MLQLTQDTRGISTECMEYAVGKDVERWKKLEGAMCASGWITNTSVAFTACHVGCLLKILLSFGNEPICNISVTMRYRKG